MNIQHSTSNIRRSTAEGVGGRSCCVVGCPTFIVVLLASALLAAGCSRRPHLYPPAPESRTVPGIGAVTIQVVATRDSRARQAIDAAFAAMTQTVNLLSTDLPHSEIARVNRESGRECHVSAQTAQALRLAKELAGLSGGAFDPTAGPLVALWNRATETGRQPSEKELSAARKLVGWQRLEVGENSARLVEPGMSIDLGGFARGCAIDQAVAALRAAGIASAMVRTGDTGYVFGAQPDGQEWVWPSGGADMAGTPASLRDAAFASRDRSQQPGQHGGAESTGSLDPRTGKFVPVAHGFSVTAPDCATAEALAQALAVLETKEAAELAKRTSGRVVFAHGDR